jgi:hypothetical protein
MYADEPKTRRGDGGSLRASAAEGTKGAGSWLLKA